MRFLVRLLVIALILGVGTVVLGKYAERWVIYPFDSTEIAPEAGLPGVTAERIEVNGAELVVWSARPEGNKPVILYFHGNAGNLAVRAGRFRQFLDRGYGLYAPAYRGSSGSSGRPSEEALVWDAEITYHALHKRFPNLPSRRVIVYGESLGAAVALSLFESPALHEGKGFGLPGGIVLEAPFTSIAALAEHLYPGTGKLAAKIDNTWRSLDRVKLASVPLMVIHGTQDELIPTEMGRQIYAAAPSKEKKLIIVKGAGHTDLWKSHTLTRLWRFIDQFALR